MIPRVVRIVPYGAPLGDPAFGPTAGRALVQIYGAGFRLPPRPTVVDPDATTPRTVEVLFADAPAERVLVVRSNLLHVVTPASPRAFDTSRVSSGVMIGAAGVVDITIRNLDDSGVPIPGEEVVVPAAYTYVNPPLGGPGVGGAVSHTTLTRVVNRFVELWARHVWPETLTHQSVEYAADGVEIRLLANANLPSIALLGPRTTTSRMFETAGDIVVAPADVGGTPPEALSLINRMPYGLDLVFDVVGQAGERNTVLNLAHVATNFVQRTPVISVQRDPADPSKGSVDYPFGFAGSETTFDVGTATNNSDLHVFRGSVVVRGVLIETVPLFGDGGTDAVGTVEIIDLRTCPF